MGYAWRRALPFMPFILPPIVLFYLKYNADGKPSAFNK